MKRNRILFLALVLLLVAGLVAGCGSGAKSETDQAKEVVDVFVEAMKKSDVETMKTVLMGSVADEMDEVVPGEDEVGIAVLDKTKFTFKEGEIPKDATEGSLKYDVEAVNLMAMDFSAMEDVTVEDIGKLDLTTSTVEIKFQKDGENWKIANGEPVVMHAVGMGALAALFENMEIMEEIETTE